MLTKLLKDEDVLARRAVVGNKDDVLINAETMKHIAKFLPKDAWSIFKIESEHFISFIVD